MEKRPPPWSSSQVRLDNEMSIEDKITVALAGNANVGKSVIFNELTGLHQHVGNWPGKTVERAEGTLNFQGTQIDIIDLPGIYSLSTYSIEEIISREYIAVEQPDVLINVIDASSLERNLAFTVQLLELNPRIVIALNQMDIAEKKGIKIDPERLSKELGIPVVTTVAVKSTGLTELMEQTINTAKKGEKAEPLKYGTEIEEQIQRLIKSIEVQTPYPERWVVIKLLEEDKEIQELIYFNHPEIKEKIQETRERIEDIHQHDAASVIASERYAIAHNIAARASSLIVPVSTFTDRLEEITSHPIAGYAFMIISLLAVFFSIFSFGDWLAGWMDIGFEFTRNLYFNLLGESELTKFVWDGVLDGIFGGLAVAVPYIGPFYLILSVLEDSGYMARIAFLMDRLMHSIGLHGKSFIPIMLGFGCNVPAVLGCRVMETEREQLICAFVASLVPCAARSMVIFGLVAAYIGFEWAMLLYLLDFILILVLGRIAFTVAPDEPVGLIMEMPGYRIPSLKTTWQRTWLRLKDFIYEAFPIMVAGNFVIQVAALLGILVTVERIMSPVTVGWLGLPSVAGVVLIFGVLRKELTLILLATVMGSTDFSAILTPVQMFVFAFVVMVYVPCLSTIAALAKEFGSRNATIITLVEVVVAVVLGGIVQRALIFLGLP
ncbi:ferrous iron transport protein B [Candidatus Bathyarchaeota archaeon]|nr:ferrous iron transport protein B [Candidatus Bathyarchaeota archaeon]